MKALSVARTPAAGRTGSKRGEHAVLTGSLHHQTTREERYAAGKALREKCPRRSHAVWKAPANRPDPVELVLRAEKGRMPDLLPLRHGRMVRSAFTFYRGAALTMAADLDKTQSLASMCSAAGTHTSATSAASPPRSGGSSSPSTIWTKRCPGPGSGT